MCLAVPGRVQEIYESRGLRTGRMDFGGVVKEVCLAYVSEVEVGDYAIVHVGVAISKIDEDSALETLGLLEETGIPKDEFGGEHMTPREVDGGVASRSDDATSPPLGSP
jgi:hydrogenase expression/formation protein HypC